LNLYWQSHNRERELDEGYKRVSRARDKRKVAKQRKGGECERRLSLDWDLKSERMVAEVQDDLHRELG